MTTTYDRRAVEGAIVIWDAIKPWLDSPAADRDDDQLAVIGALMNPKAADLASYLLLEYGGPVDVNATVEELRGPRGGEVSIEDLVTARRSTRVNRRTRRKGARR